jgi:thiol-disulfide isomerase/thioredoxin
MAASRIAFAALLFASLAPASGPSEPPAHLSLPNLQSEPQSLEQYRGQIVVLNFWATWCVPCREEMPLLVEAQKRYAEQGVTVIGASADDASTQAKIAPFVEELSITFPIWTGATIPDMERLGLGSALPATAILDRDGRIAFRIIGVIEPGALTERIEHLLSNRQGKALELLIDTLSEAMHEQEGHDHGHAEEEHTHGGVGVEGASMVPS